MCIPATAGAQIPRGQHMDTNTTSAELDTALYALESRILQSVAAASHAYRLAKVEGNRKVMSDLIQAHDGLNALRNSL